MKKVLEVIGMSCEHCERAVKEALNEIQGVNSVTVNLKSKQVEVDGENLNDLDIRNAVEEAGYVVESIK
jgi:copper chaperone